MYRAIKSMYKVVKARVRVGGDLTEPFMSSRIVTEGNMQSSDFVFTFY